MEAIRKYSTEPGFPQAVDRWSFAMKQAEWDDVSGGIAGDFGFSVFFRAEGDLRVKYVERASPAGVKGMHRGWRVTKINGSTNITTANSDFIVDAIFYSTSGNFTFQKPDGSSVDVALTATTYQEHPIFLDSVYTAGTKKVGYMVFNSFLGDTTEVYSEFQRIFNKFNAQGVNDVAVDLRYNGGGYVSVQQKLANYLVSNAASGGVMMNQVFNDKYASWNESDNFNKLGPLNLPRVFFIVSNNTASASELLINNLRPYMDVKLVGPGATYGKPVGYFPIPVGDWYIFPVSFRSTNKNGQGNYFSGFSVDSQQPDGLDKDWGDINETAFASVLKYVGTGSFTRTTEIPGAANISVTPQIINSNQKLDVKSFKGAVLSSRKLN
jgi:C-terminal processing protease CtpA/Prc